MNRRQDVRDSRHIDPTCLCEHDVIERDGRLPTLIRIRKPGCPVPHDHPTTSTRRALAATDRLESGTR